jgi:hypothetical protein
MIDSVVKFTPTRFYETLSMSQVRGETQLVRKGRRRSDPTMPLWSDQLPVQRAGGRGYHHALRSASAGCDVTRRRNKDSEVPASSSQCASPTHTYWGHRKQNWIAGERNGITRSHPDGQRVARTGRGEKRVVRWVDLEAYLNSTNTIES